MPWAGGVYSRGYPSWTNDAANNLPISATKFDTEDNDFAAGLNNCLSKDGLSVPNAAMTWGLSSAQVLSLTRGSDGNAFSVGRTGGSNNPTIQFQLADATGAAINLSTAQQLAFAINGTNALALTSTTATFASGLAVMAPSTINVTAGTGVGLTITGNATAAEALLVSGGAGQYAAKFSGASGAGNGFGVFINGGTNSADYAIRIQNQAGTIDYGYIKGDGSGVLGYNGTTSVLSWAATGAASIAAASSGRSLTVNGGSGNYTEAILGNSASGNSYGLYISAGTNTSDVSFRVDNQSAGSTYFEIWGDGEIVVPAPPAASQVSASVFQVGYLETPIHDVSSGSTALVLTDRGKFMRLGAGFTYTIPANSSVAFPIGTTIVLMNAGGSSCSIPITTDSMTFLPSGGSGTRTLAANSVATLYKYGATNWYIWGFGLT